MLRRFASGCLVASILVALAAIALLLSPVISIQRFAVVFGIWCLVPFIWGIWAMMIPQNWTPERFPLWGAILGVIAGFLAAFVLDVPARILGAPVSITFQSIGYIVVVALYYVVWHFVGIAYNKLKTIAPTEKPKAMGKAV